MRGTHRKKQSCNKGWNFLSAQWTWTNDRVSSHLDIKSRERWKRKNKEKAEIKKKERKKERERERRMEEKTDWPTTSTKSELEALWPSALLTWQEYHPSSSRCASTTLNVPFGYDLVRREGGKSWPSVILVIADIETGKWKKGKRKRRRGRRRRTS